MRGRIQSPCQDFSSYFKTVRLLSDLMGNLSTGRLVDLLCHELRPGIEGKLLFFSANTHSELHKLVYQSAGWEKRILSSHSDRSHRCSVESVISEKFWLGNKILFWFGLVELTESSATAVGFRRPCVQNVAFISSALVVKVVLFCMRMTMKIVQ